MPQPQPLNDAKEATKTLLRACGLRITAPRLAVLDVLASSEYPISHSEVVHRLSDQDWDPATIYRNLIKLKEVGLASVVGDADGIARYALAREDDDHHGHHPHFTCEDCGKVACLPAELIKGMEMEGIWAASIAGAVVQLRGECPDCLAAREAAASVPEPAH